MVFKKGDAESFSHLRETAPACHMSDRAGRAHKVAGPPQKPHSGAALRCIRPSLAFPNPHRSGKRILQFTARQNPTIIRHIPAFEYAVANVPAFTDTATRGDGRDHHHSTQLRSNSHVPLSGDRPARDFSKRRIEKSGKFAGHTREREPHKGSYE
jgi:hypothetical protein